VLCDRVAGIALLSDKRAVRLAAFSEGLMWIRDGTTAELCKDPGIIVNGRGNPWDQTQAAAQVTLWPSNARGSS